MQRMGFRLNKRIRLGKGLRLNLGTKGVSLSVGRRGAWYTVHSSGKTTQTVGIPGTGLSYRTHGRVGRTRAPKPPVLARAKPGLFAPRDEKAFSRGIDAYAKRDFASALAAFEDSMREDPRGDHVGEEYMGAMCLFALGRTDDGIEMLERVVSSRAPLPDALMQKYGVAGDATVDVTPHIRARLAMGNLAAALMLAEALQRTGRAERAADLLENLGAAQPGPVFALSLADLYAELGRWDDVLRVSDDFTRNDDDATAQLLVYRARALRENALHDGALEALREALRSRSRSGGVLLAARYERALTYEAAGKHAASRKELERIYAQDTAYADVATRLGV